MGYNVVFNQYSNYIRLVRTTNTLLTNCRTRIIPNNRALYSTNVQTSNLKVLRKKVGPGAIFLLSIPISTFGLGVWQIQRKQWKENLISDLTVKTKLPPIPLPESDEDMKELDFRAVTVRGVFDHANEMYLGPRSCLTHGDSSANQGKLISSKSDNVSGYLVVTPFILSDTNKRILVNRGWVSFKQKRAATRREGQINGEVELTGIVRLSEPPPAFTAPNKLDVRVWFYRDVEKMADFAGTRAVYLDATVESTVPGGPIGGQTRSNLRNEHFSYVVTWFSLSAATAVMWYFRFIH